MAVSRLFGAAGPSESSMCTERGFVDFGNDILSAPAGLGWEPTSARCPEAAMAGDTPCFPLNTQKSYGNDELKNVLRRNCGIPKLSYICTLDFNLPKAKSTVRLLLPDVININYNFT